MSFKVKDFYYKKAKKQNYTARSVYKLSEIHNKFGLFVQENRVLDLGHSPGSWAQYASEMIGKKGLVVGVDLKEPHPGCGRS